MCSHHLFLASTSLKDLIGQLDAEQKELEAKRQALQKSAEETMPKTRLVPAAQLAAAGISAGFPGGVVCFFRSGFSAL